MHQDLFVAALLSFYSSGFEGCNAEKISEGNLAVQSRPVRVANPKNGGIARWLRNAG